MNRFDRAGIALSLVSLVLPLAAQRGGVQRMNGPGEVEEGITVEGIGEAVAAADTLEYRAMLVGGAETLPDAMVEYDRVVTRLSKALDQLGIKGLTHELHGTTLNNLTDAMHRKAQEYATSSGFKAPSKCEVQECLTIRIPIEGMTLKDVNGMVVGIMGVAAELGLVDQQNPTNLSFNFKPPPVHVPSGWTWGISYVVRDPEKLYAKVVSLAIEDANTKARLRAGFIGGKLGNIVAVETRSGGSIQPGKTKNLQHRMVLRVRYDFVPHQD